MFEVANALLTMRGMRRVSGTILFENGVPVKGLFDSIEGQIENPYIHFYPTGKVTLAFLNPVTGEYELPYYDETQEGSYYFFVNPICESDTFTIEVGERYCQPLKYKEIDSKIDSLYGDMGL